MSDLDREQTKGFLDALEARLRTRLRKARQAGSLSIGDQIEQIATHARQDAAERHLKSREAAFLNRFVAPAISEALVASGLSEMEARELLLTESYKALAAISSGPAARPVAFPFEKKMGVSARTIYDRWVGRTQEQPFKQPYPDLAIRAPFKIVLEGKYFRSGSLEYAERQLVTAIHETLFYLGVPEVEERGRPWSYRYACLVAFDGSPEGSLLKAWQSLGKVRDQFWRAANLKVILIGEQEIAGQD